MHFNTIQEFRHGLYQCFTRAEDALFSLNDALLTFPQAQSLVELSLSPLFKRRWSSLYAALSDGQIARDKWLDHLARFAPPPPEGKALLVGIDATNIPRPESPTARDRTYLYLPNLPECKAPVTVGWQFSSLVVLPHQPSSSSYYLDQKRIESAQTACQVAAAQLKALVPVVPWRVLSVADRYYGSAAFVLASQEIDCDKLLRIKGNRLFYRQAPEHTAKRGAPRKDGAVFRCKDPASQGPPQEQWQGTDEKGQGLEVVVWHKLHFRKARSISLSVLRVTRHGASGKKRDPKISWLIWVGKANPVLEEVWRNYRLRFSLEQGYRYDKQELLWGEAHLRTPERFQLWTDIMSGVHNQLVLLQKQVAGQKRAWENKQRPTSLGQVRRVAGTIIGQLGTPAKMAQVRGKSPGREKGAEFSPIKRYAVVKKTVGGKKNSRK